MTLTVSGVRRVAREFGLRLTSGMPPRCTRCGRYMRRRRVLYFGAPRKTWRCSWCDEMAREMRLP